MLFAIDKEVGITESKEMPDGTLEFVRRSIAYQFLHFGAGSVPMAANQFVWATQDEENVGEVITASNWHGDLTKKLRFRAGKLSLDDQIKLYLVMCSKLRELKDDPN